MLGYVKQSDYTHEHTLRVLAEENAHALLAQLTQAQATIDSLVAQNERERLASDGRYRDLLDRTVLKPDFTATDNGNGQPSAYTSEVVRNLRAYGKSDMLFRSAEAHRLENEEMTDAQRKDRERRHESLTADEKKELSQSEGDLLDNMLKNAAQKVEVAPDVHAS